MKLFCTCLLQCYPNSLPVLSKSAFHQELWTTDSTQLIGCDWGVNLLSQAEFPKAHYLPEIPLSRSETSFRSNNIDNSFCSAGIKHIKLLLPVPCLEIRSAPCLRGFHQTQGLQMVATSRAQIPRGFLANLRASRGRHFDIPLTKRGIQQCKSMQNTNGKKKHVLFKKKKKIKIYI